MKLNANVSAVVTGGASGLGAATARRLAQQGVKVRLFASGDYKGAGYPGVPLTDKQAANIQESIASINSDFRAHIMSARGPLDTADMEGQTFRAMDAQNRGFVDVITADWRATLADV